MAVVDPVVGVVADVVLGDVAVGLVGELGDEVGVEPFLGGDPVGLVVEVDAFPAGGDAGAFGLRRG